MSDILTRDDIRLGLSAADKADALRQCGAQLVDSGAATQAYAEALFDRERQVSTYLGEGVAIPHGTNESREHILATKLGFLQFPDGVDWDGETVHVCIPIASQSDAHVDILAALADVLMEPDSAQQLRTATDPDAVLALLGAVSKEA